MVDLDRIKQIIEAQEHEIYGLRAHRSGTPVVGETLGRSYDWVDGEMTDWELPGICTLRVMSPDEVDAAVDRLVRYYCWDDEVLVLVGGDSGEWGTDDGEYIISDNVCLAVIGRHEAKTLLPIAA